MDTLETNVPIKTKTLKKIVTGNLDYATVQTLKKIQNYCNIKK